MTEPEIALLYENLREISNFVEKLKLAHESIKKSNKFDFNFFEGVTSNKFHHEKYHSNFLCYLLNPKSSHNCGSYFLKKFIANIDSTEIDFFKNLAESELENAVAKTESIITNGRRIDITIEYRKDWIIFIENKVWHSEGDEQLNDYFNFSLNYKNQLPLFLTPTKRKSESINNENEAKIISLGYDCFIKTWLHDCIAGLIRFPHITSVLNQYIDILNKLFNLLEDKEMEEILKSFDSHRKELCYFLSQKDSINSALVEFIPKEREIFITEFRKILFDKIETEIKGLRILKEFEGDTIHLRYNEFEFSMRVGGSDNGSDGGFGAWWGVYNSEGAINCNLELGNFETIDIDGIQDYTDYDKGIIKIIELNGNHEKRSIEILKSVEIIISKLKNNVLNFLLRRAFFDKIRINFSEKIKTISDLKVINPFTENSIKINYKSDNYNFDICENNPDNRDGGKGSWIRVYKNDKSFNCGFEKDYWEGIKINKQNDFYYPTNFFELLNSKNENELAEEVANSIFQRFNEKVLNL